MNKKLFARADASVDKIFSSPRIRLSNSQRIIFDGVETGILLSDCAQQIRRKNADVPDIYFTVLEAAGMSPTLVLNENAKTKEGASWVPFKISTSEAAKIVHAGWCCLRLCAHFSES